VRPEDSRAVVERVVREEWGTVLAALVARIHDLQLAEDSLQDALVIALSSWPKVGKPNSPRAWLIKVAGRKMIDHVRRRENLRGKESFIVAEMESTQSEGELGVFQYKDDEVIPDERLRLIFTCCHPALSLETRIPLTLQMLGGLRTVEISRAFLVSVPTMSQRLVRAKKKIKASGIPYEVPQEEHIAERLSGVLKVLYLIFNEGYSSLTKPNSEAAFLCDEAIRLARVLARLVPTHSEASGLLAMMLFHHARSFARTDGRGSLVILEEQDRSLWDQAMLMEGHQMLNVAIASRQPGPYILQAAISALHSEAVDHSSTDWSQIHQLYMKLYEFDGDPIVLVNAAVALSYTDRLEGAMSYLDSLKEVEKMKNYQPFYAACGDVLGRLGRCDEACSAYEQAINLTDNIGEKKLFEERLKALF